MKTVYYQDWGTLPYGEALDRQLKYFTATRNAKSANRDSRHPVPTRSYLFVVRHPHVFTLGKNARETNLLWDDNILTNKGISVYRTNRGGDVTYHGPGQLVVYPILDLDHFTGDIHRYMRMLEQMIINVLSDYGIRGERIEGKTGVWIDAGTPAARKICAMGVHTSRWVTMHGLALNANVDLSYYRGIIPCGIADMGVTSMHRELGRTVDENVLKDKILRQFSAVFSARLSTFRDSGKTAVLPASTE